MEYISAKFQIKKGAFLARIHRQHNELEVAGNFGIFVAAKLRTTSRLLVFV